MSSLYSPLIVELFETAYGFMELSYQVFVLQVDGLRQLQLKECHKVIVPLVIGQLCVILATRGQRMEICRAQYQAQFTLSIHKSFALFKVTGVIGWAAVIRGVKWGSAEFCPTVGVRQARHGLLAVFGKNVVRWFWKAIITPTIILDCLDQRLCQYWYII